MERKIKVVLLALLSMCLLMPVNTFADTTSSIEGLNVSITSDKDEYSGDEDITIAIFASNNGINTYENGMLSLEIPKDLEIKSGDSKSKDIVLGVGEEYETEIVIRKKDNSSDIQEEITSGDKTESVTEEASKDTLNDSSDEEQENHTNPESAKNNTTGEQESVSTGDTLEIMPKLVLCVVAICVFMILTAKKKSMKKLLSMFLCATLVATLIPNQIFAEENTTNVYKITVDKTIQVDGEEYVIRATFEAEKIIQNRDEEFTVTFNYSDDHTEKGYVTVKKGERVLQPQNPERDGFIFDGWHTEDNHLFDFDTIIDRDYTLHAVWKENSGVESEPLSGSTTDVSVYAITELTIDPQNCTATAIVSAPANCGLVVRFIEEDIYFSEDYPANKSYIQNGDLYGSHVVAAGCNMEEVEAKINGSLPQYYVAEAVLIDGNGNELCNPYSSIEHTARKEAFNEKTIYDFGENDHVLNFDSQIDDNFGVLADEVKIVDAINVTAEENDSIIKYTVTGANEEIQVGNKVFISDEDDEFLFTVNSVETVDNCLVLTSLVSQNSEDAKSSVVDYYKFMKFSQTCVMDSETEETEITEEVLQDESDELLNGWNIKSVSNNGSASMDLSLDVINYHGEYRGIPYEVKGNVSGSIKASVDFEWDIVLFGRDYLRFDLEEETDLNARVSIGISNDSDEGIVCDKSFTLGKVKIPFGVTGLNAYGDIEAELSFELEASAGLEGHLINTAGIKYNTRDGVQKYEKKDNTWEVDCKGSAEVKFGPSLGVGIELLGGVLNAGVNLFAGGVLEGEAVIPIFNGGTKKHECNLCLSGEVKAVVEVSAELGYTIIPDVFEDSFEWTICSFGKTLFDFHISIINPKNSKYGGKLTFKTGECENNSYRINLNAKDENNHEVLTNITVTDVDSGAEKGTVRTPGNIYLFEGTYVAKAKINGTECEKTFVVLDTSKTVTLIKNKDNGYIKGSVHDADNNSPIAGASISVVAYMDEVAKTVTDTSGNYSLTIEDGTYKVLINAEGYVPAVQYVTISDGETKYLDSMLMAKENKDEIMGGIYGTIKDAVTGRELSGVDVKISEGWGNESVTNTYVAQKTTDTNGYYSCKKWSLFGMNYGLDAGNYTVTISKDGYIPTTFNITIVGGKDLQFNSTITPVGLENEYRIVLTWGETPSDLDSHLIGTTGDNEEHVYYYAKDGYASNLDVDDTSSYGPETVTIPDLSQFDGKLYYAVHDYSNRYSTESDEMSYSSACVKVFKGGNLLKAFYIPTGIMGNVWNVFYFDEYGNIVPVNTFCNNSNPSEIMGR